MLEMPDVPEVQKEDKQTKKEKQHLAWKRWYDSPKGQAWRDKRRKTPKPEEAK